ncbi:MULTISPECIES: hypothetical protein [Vibrio]|uniref:hypothetical protein n=1 Tax=Vibrio TaxID=662 RepID=UPI0008418008|nr:MULTISPECIES: hypothetical protein [Vibrio]ODM57044.1 hypothetical protein BC455_18300 [Vibrio harveyi]USD58612.1 hypothetical protein J4N44_27045 [Vibrio sp. SCSIO 43155]
MKFSNINDVKNKLASATLHANKEGDETLEVKTSDLLELLLYLAMSEIELNMNKDSDIDEDDTLQRSLLLKAIKGSNFKSARHAMEMEGKGYAYFCGNQQNADWEWDLKKIDKLPTKELYLIYSEMEKSS